MPVAGIVTLVAIALVVLVLAAYLLHVIWLLRKTSFTLGTIVAGLRAIAHQTAPVGDVVAGINDDLGQVRAALEQILGRPLDDEAGHEHDPVNV